MAWAQACAPACCTRSTSSQCYFMMCCMLKLLPLLLLACNCHSACNCAYAFSRPLFAFGVQYKSCYVVLLWEIDSDTAGELRCQAYPCQGPTRRSILLGVEQVWATGSWGHEKSPCTMLHIARWQRRMRYLWVVAQHADLEQSKRLPVVPSIMWLSDALPQECTRLHTKLHSLDHS